MTQISAPNVPGITGTGLGLIAGGASGFVNPVGNQPPVGGGLNGMSASGGGALGGFDPGIVSGAFSGHWPPESGQGSGTGVNTDTTMPPYYLNAAMPTVLFPLGSPPTLGQPGNAPGGNRPCHPCPCKTDLPGPPATP